MCTYYIKYTTGYIDEFFYILKQVWSNDRIRSCTHRVIMGGNEDRYSIGLFTFHDGTINIPEKLVDEKHPLHYKPFNHLGYVDYYYSNKVSQPNQCRYKAYGGI